MRLSFRVCLCALLPGEFRNYSFVRLKPPCSVRTPRDCTLLPAWFPVQIRLYSFPQACFATCLVHCGLVSAKPVKDVVDGQALIRFGFERLMNVRDHGGFLARCGVLLRRQNRFLPISCLRSSVRRRDVYCISCVHVLRPTPWSPRFVPCAFVRRRVWYVIHVGVITWNCQPIESHVDERDRTYVYERRP